MGTNKFTRLSPWDPERKKRENELRRYRMHRRVILTRTDILAGTGTDEDVTPKFTPDMLGPALRLWIDPSDSTTMILSGSEVHAINDKSGSGYNFNTSATRPTLTNGTILLNDGTYLEGINPFGVAGAEYFIATENVGNDPAYLLFSVGTASPYIMVAQSDNPSEQTHSGEVAGGEFVDGVQLSSPTRQSLHAALGTAPKVYEARDVGTSFSKLRIGGYGPPWSANGIKVYGIIITTALTDTQRAQVRTYLASKQGRSL